MSARDDRTTQMRTYAGSLPFISLAAQYLSWAADEIDRLRAAKEPDGAYEHVAEMLHIALADVRELEVEVAELRVWKQEAEAWVLSGRTKGTDK